MEKKYEAPKVNEIDVEAAANFAISNPNGNPSILPPDTTTTSTASPPLLPID